MWRVAGILLQMIQHGPAQHVRQKNIQHDRQRVEFAGQRAHMSRRGSVTTPLNPLLPHHTQQDLREMRIVLDDQHNRVAGQHGFPVIVDLLPACCACCTINGAGLTACRSRLARPLTVRPEVGLRQIQREGAAFARAC